jgi:multiple sugar transport system permease protein
MSTLHASTDQRAVDDVSRGALRTSGARPGSQGRTQTGRHIPWLYLSPALAVLLVMTIGPAIYIFYTSFRNDSILGGAGQFVGLRNYETAISDPGTQHAFVVTLMFVLIAVVLEMGIGLALAIPLSRQTASSKLAATLMLLPFAVTPAVAAMVFKQLVNPNYGWLPHYLQFFGLPPNLDLLGDPVGAWAVLIVLDLWQWTPFVALILMAGLQSLPLEPIEAAMVDGANKWQVFRHITLPGLVPFLAIALVLRTIQAFKTFDSFKIVTGGGPGNSTEMINLGIYRIGLQSFNIGLACATAVLLLIVLSILIPFIQTVIGKRADPEEA